jgi:hypothetical protein
MTKTLIYSTILPDSLMVSMVTEVLWSLVEALKTKKVS